MYFLSFAVSSIGFLIGGLAITANCAPTFANTVESPAIKSVRSANTCADPSLAHPMYQAFRKDITAHPLDWLYHWEDGNTEDTSLTWLDIKPAFLAWPTQQNFTAPLFRLNSADDTNIMYKLGVDAQTPPVVSGFPAVSLLAWVYSSQVCGSVPLLSASLPAFTDHYLTTSTFEHDGLVNVQGWTDTGVVAWVLPLPNSES